MLEEKGRIESGEIEIFYIYDQTGSKEKVITKTKNQLTHLEANFTSMAEKSSHILG